jgi:DnaK suppressor protein
VTESLTDSELRELGARLRETAQEISSALASSEDSERPVDLEEPIGRISRMDAIQQQKMAKASRSRLKTRLQAIGAATARLEAGDYGDCALCDDPIGFGRLSARPETPLCMPCQSEREGG